MASGSISIGGTISGTPTGVKQINEVVNIPAAVGQITDITLASGFNSIPVPAGATYALIQPPAGSVVTLTLKGVTGDTGVPLHPSNPTLIALPSGATTLGLTTGGAATGSTEINFV